MTPPMMKFSFIFELLSAGIGLNMDGVVVISILLELFVNFCIRYTFLDMSYFRNIIRSKRLFIFVFTHYISL